jgi:hypothetical protein
VTAIKKKAQARGTSFIAAALIALIAMTVCLVAYPQQQAEVFKVESAGRYLLDPKGKPFFWLGDTAWLLCHRTRREDVELYLQTRAKQGFTVIQAAAVMAEERVRWRHSPQRLWRLSLHRRGRGSTEAQSQQQSEQPDGI